MSKKIKIFVIVVLVIIVVIAISMLTGNKKAPASTTGITSSKVIGGVSTTPGAASAGQNEFATALSSIKTIDIDTSIFANPAYKALRDYPVDLGTDIIGRSNPFAPVGTDQGDTTTSATLQVQTLQPAKVTNNAADFAAQVTLADAVPATVVFEYGTDDTFGSASAPIPVSRNGTALYHVTGLQGGTTYYVRAVAAQGSQTVPANTMTFITSANPRR